MKQIAECVNKPARAEKVLFFGEGNFLRAFAAVAVKRMNERAGFDGSIVILQGTEKGRAADLNAQNGLYTVIERGYADGRPVETILPIDCVSRAVDPYADYGAFLALADNPDLALIVSNTTEAGIHYDENERAGQEMYRNFPAKLTDFLYRRFSVFGGAAAAGLVVLPCELIEENGRRLKECVLRYAADWGLGKAFVGWINEAMVFADTLVDRIVSGYPNAEADAICRRLGYEDCLLDACEPFFLWVIGSTDRRVRTLPLESAGAVLTDDITPYRTRKVRILNGAHTMSAPAGLLSGLETVEQLVCDKTFGRYIQRGLREEVIPACAGDGLEQYAAAVIARFHNPYLNHRLADIALNSVSKWRARVLPSVKDFMTRYGKPPAILAYSFAALYAFYRKGEGVRDDGEAIARMRGAASVTACLADARLWGEDLTALPGFAAAAETQYRAITAIGARKAAERLTTEADHADD